MSVTAEISVFPTISMEIIYQYTTAIPELTLSKIDGSQSVQIRKTGRQLFSYIYTFRYVLLI